jgi:hypothetical protein
LPSRVMQELVDDMGSSTLTLQVYLFRIACR